MNTVFVGCTAVVFLFVMALCVVIWLGRRQVARLSEKNRQLSTGEAVLYERLQSRNDMVSELECRLQEAVAENKALYAENRGISAELKNARQQTELLHNARKELSESFKAVSADIYRANSESFLKLAGSTLAHYQEKAKEELSQRKSAIKDMVKPLQESLDKVDTHIRQLEKERVSSYASLSEQVKSMAVSQSILQGETANLVRALRTPVARGRWGEMQLRRVVEMAGMVEYCDFAEQQTVEKGENALRPDMVVNLPNGKSVVVDSKASLQAYLEAHEIDNESLRREKLKKHARQIRTHLVQLGSKGYWQQFQTSPEFVIMFVPGENFFSAALSQDPELIEFGVAQKVILATPTTLIALLRAVSYGWRQEQIAEHAEKIGELGKTLYGRLRVLSGHFEDLRKNLDRSVQAYNRAAGSFESRVLVTARKFQEIDPGLGSEIAEITPIDKTTRGIGHDSI